MSDLVAFLNARLDEDEAMANRNATAWDEAEDWVRYEWDDVPDNIAELYGRFGSARVRREVEAKRRILTRYEFARNQVAVGEVNEAAGYGPADGGWPLRADSHELDVRALAAVYSDHPDYDPAWA